MRRYFASILLAASLVPLNAGQSYGEPICRPAFEFKQARLSEARAQQRLWTATLSVDASACASSHGSFYIGFVRLKEMTPDLMLVERFAWKLEQVEVSVTLWQDEAVGDHWISHVSLCPCRARVGQASDGPRD